MSLSAHEHRFELSAPARVEGRTIIIKHAHEGTERRGCVLYFGEVGTDNEEEVERILHAAGWRHTEPARVKEG